MLSERDRRELREVFEAAAERRRQESRVRPAYRARCLGLRHGYFEREARRLLREAQAGRWLQFYAASPYDAAAVDQCLRYIVRQERPAESVRVEWLERDGAWRDGFPRPRDRGGHGDYAHLGRHVREIVAELEGRDAADAGTFDGRELARLERVNLNDGGHWYTGRLRLVPKRGTVPPPAFPRPRRSAAGLLGDALTGR
jgi:hypothetical protein